jgi:flagellar motor switch protein FliM
MGDILSQAEVEHLLNAIEGEDSAPGAGQTESFRPREKVTVYDFKRPERVGKEQMRSLQTMHEGFGRNFGAALSALLRTMVEVKLTSVDQLTYSEFVFSLENPTCFNLITARPLEGQLILDINPSI